MKQLSDSQLEQIVNWANGLKGPLPSEWKNGLKCPDCGSDSDRPKCFYDYGPTCVRHDPDSYDEKMIDSLRGPHVIGAMILLVIDELKHHRKGEI
jgi:hypothetical protein